MFKNKTTSAVLAVMLMAAGTASGLAKDAFSARGVIRALNQAKLSAGIDERIAKMAFREGETFAKGAVLVQFSCARLRARHDVARAVYQARRAELSNKAFLRRNMAAGEFELVIAKANARKARAELAVVEADIAHCRIKAPFAGRVARWHKHPYETPQKGEPIIEIVDDTTIEVELITPSKWLTWLKPGTPFTIKVDETARGYKAIVRRLGSVVDPVSQTVKVQGVLTGERRGVLPGMSGTATFKE